MHHTVKQNFGKLNIVQSLFWKLLESGGAQFANFIVQIILARLLLPEDYGKIVLITIFITVSSVFVQSGFGTALVQKKEVSENDFSSVFYCTFLIAIFLYCILFLFAPVIADFYRDKQLIPVLRVLSLTLFFMVFVTVQNTIVYREMNFKKLFFSNSGAIVLSGTTGIVLAYMGFGVWALVAQQLVNHLAACIILWFTVKWRPKLVFSFSRIMELLTFAWKILVASLLDTIFMDLHSLIIGKIYHPGILGYYNKGKQFPYLMVSNINGSIQSVIFPVLSFNQDNISNVKNMVRRSVTVSSFIVFPMMTGLAVVAEPLVSILLTDKWLQAVPFLRIHCIIYALWPLHTANLQAINALGRSDIFLKLEIVKKVYGLIILAISLNYGIGAIIWGSAISGFISAIVNAYPNRKLLNYSYQEQCVDIFPSIVLSAWMGFLVYLIQFIHLNTVVLLISQILAGIMIYFTMAKIFKLESFRYMCLSVKELVSRKGRPVDDKIIEEKMNNDLYVKEAGL